MGSVIRIGSRESRLAVMQAEIIRREIERLHPEVKKHYRSVPGEIGEVLLPPFKLQYADTVTLGLKPSIFGRLITIQGIRL